MLVDPAFARVALREVARDVFGSRRPTATIPYHLEAAVSWLALAQEQAANGGVSAGFGRTGWLPDYPETTGYIICTFLDYFHLTAERVFLGRARRMADYECRVQQDDGAIPGGYASPRQPYVFDTGQVISGWVALYSETGEAQYLAAARRAGNWLLSIQDGDGSWAKCDHAPSPRTYHARVAWPLIALGQVAGEARFVEAGRKHIAWVVANQLPNGWFAHAELKGQTFPVTHTIAYTVQGVLESAVLLQAPAFLAAARRAADALLERQQPDGRLAGAYDRQWRAVANWSCLTGCAQMSINWLRLYELTGDASYKRGGERSNAFLRGTQDLQTDAPVRGAIKGSLPFWGDYQRFSYPNWATKFFADALILECRLTESNKG